MKIDETHQTSFQIRASHRRSRPNAFLAQFLPPTLVLIVSAGAVECLVAVLGIKPYLLPRPSLVIATLFRERADLLNGLWTTAKGALLGFAASAVIGTLSAIALASSIWARRAFYPYTLFFQTVPLVAVAPLLIFWLDPGLTSVAVCAFIVSVFPVIANTLTGLRSTDPALLDLFRLYHAGPFARLLKLRLPSALPSLFTGLRVAAGLAVIGTVVAEFLVGTLGAGEGLGVRISNAAKNGHTDRVFAAVLLASFLGLALFGAINLAGLFLLRRWHASEQS